MLGICAEERLSHLRRCPPCSVPTPTPQDSHEIVDRPQGLWKVAGSYPPTNRASSPWMFPNMQVLRCVPAFNCASQGKRQDGRVPRAGATTELYISAPEAAPPAEGPATGSPDPHEPSGPGGSGVSKPRRGGSGGRIDMVAPGQPF